MAMRLCSLKEWRAQVVLVALVGLTACGGSQDNSTRPLTNPNEPNANQVIVSQQVVGESRKSTSVYQMIDAGDGNFYFNGLYNGTPSVGKISPAGVPLWVTAVTDDFSGIYGVPAALSPGAFFAVGVKGVRNDQPASDDVGVIVLFSASGAALQRLEVAQPDGIDLHAVSQALNATGTESQQSYYAFGEAGGQPAMILFTVSGDGTLTLDAVGGTFSGVAPFASIWAVLPTGSSSAPIAIAGRVYDDAAGDHELNAFVALLSDALEVQWSQNLVATQGLHTFFQSLVLSGEDLIVVGSTDAVKGIPPSNGGYWTDGFAAAVSMDGTQNWLSPVNVSQHDDGFNSALVQNGILYAAGGASDFSQNGTEVGYGLVSVIDLNSGTVLGSHTFGNHSTESGLNSILSQGSSGVLGGFTNGNGTTFQGWLVQVAIDSLGFPTGTPTASLTPTREAPINPAGGNCQTAACGRQRHRLRISGR